MPPAPAPEPRSVAEAFLRTAERHPERSAVRRLDEDPGLTWDGLRRQVAAVAAGLGELGVERGESVALLLSNRPEFHVLDLAVMVRGAVPFSLYPTLPPEQMEYVVNDSGARVVVVERALFERFAPARPKLRGVEHVVLLDGEEPGTRPFASLEGAGGAFDLEAAVARLRPEDALTLIYTSGTTGPPKGVELTHANMLHAAAAFDAMIRFPDGARVVSWLPAAHIAERAAHHYLPIIFGFSVTTCPDPRQIAAVLPQVRPTWFFAVPRIWEKLKAGLEARMAALPDDQRAPVEAALRDAREKVRLAQAGEPIPAELAERCRRADEAIFAKLRALLGLDEARAVAAGAAPTPPEVLEFFHAIGIEVGELWGMSETCGAGTANPPGRVRIGSVGLPAEGVELRLADDGEILVRGGCVMHGYRNLPDATAKSLDAEGWLATGDIGEIDADGYVRIVDRKKELIINAAGKNMSPAHIESTLKASSPMIGQACVIGDRRPYNTALLVLDADYAPAWAERNARPGRELAELAKDEAVRAAVAEGVEAANAKLARVEQIKRFTILPEDWLPGGDELTPTMKLKRKPIAEKYASAIESMYASEAR